jgi:hypothetical protein
MEKGKADRGLGITARLWDSSLIRNSASESLQIGQRSEMKGALIMKKLMIAATAALCATVSLADVVSSANVVGYAPAELQEDGITAGACFIPVSAQKFDLLDLKVTGFEEYTEADVYVQTLDEFGRTVNTYYTTTFLVN